MTMPRNTSLDAGQTATLNTSQSITVPQILSVFLIECPYKKSNLFSMSPTMRRIYLKTCGTQSKPFFQPQTLREAITLNVRELASHSGINFSTNAQFNAIAERFIASSNTLYPWLTKALLNQDEIKKELKELTMMAAVYSQRDEIYHAALEVFQSFIRLRSGFIGSQNITIESSKPTLDSPTDKGIKIIPATESLFHPPFVHLCETMFPPSMPVANSTCLDHKSVELTFTASNVYDLICHDMPTQFFATNEREVFLEGVSLAFKDREGIRVEHTPMSKFILDKLKKFNDLFQANPVILRLELLSPDSVNEHYWETLVVNSHALKFLINQQRQSNRAV